MDYEEAMKMALTGQPTRDEYNMFDELITSFRREAGIPDGTGLDPAIIAYTFLVAGRLVQQEDDAEDGGPINIQLSPNMAGALIQVLLGLAAEGQTP